jgi:DNA-binding response OmpR family regulator
MPTILVVEDEPQIAEIARDYLAHAGFSVIVAPDGLSALDLVQEHRPNLVVLDLGIPAVDGLEVTRRLRRDGSIPIIILTARVSEADRLRGLEAGADDYITKPFSPRELVARVRAVLRRVEPRDSGATMVRGDITIDRERRTVMRSGEPIEFTSTEFQLLATLAAHPGRIFTRSRLLDAVRGTDVESFERAIDTHVKNIRRKLESDPRTPRYIQTIYGVGYRVAE